MKRIFSIIFLSVILSVSFILPVLAADPVLVETISLSDTTVCVPIGKAVTVKAVPEPKKATNKKLSWASSDESIATVKNGQIKGLKSGAAIITVSAEDGSGVAASVDVKVVTPIKKIIPTEQRLILAPDTMWELSWTIEPDDADVKDIEWSSNSEKIATVDDNGVISAHAVGNCKITGTAKDGSKTKTAIDVRVKEHEIVITKPGEIKVDFSTEEKTYGVWQEVGDRIVAGYKYDILFKTEHGCVTSPYDGVIVPVKPGSDTIIMLTNMNNTAFEKETHTVFVARSALGESVSTAKDGSTEDILFLGIPWNSSFPEAEKVIQDRGKTVKPPAKHDEYVRAIIDGEITFVNYTATNAALNFKYDPAENDFKNKNRLYKGDLYFSPDIEFDKILHAVMSVYGLDEGESSDEKCTWDQGSVHLELTKKKKYIILEITNNENQ